MPERIDTKAVLADCLSPNPANYKSDFLCMTKALLQLETVRAALAQEIADHAVDRKRLETAERHLGAALAVINDTWDILVGAAEISYERRAINRLMDVRHQPWAVEASALAAEEET